jgi:hypothetical protein
LGASSKARVAANDLARIYRRVVFLVLPTGNDCREDRCQSAFEPELIPTMRPPMAECEAAGAVRDAEQTAEPVI